MLTETLVRDGARVVIGYFVAFFVTIYYQVVAKKRAINNGRKAEKENQNVKFNRYALEDDALIGADRAVGNFIEWAPSFLSLFFVALYFGKEKAVIPGYAYILFRLCYVLLVSRGGITRYGTEKFMLIATLPMYLILFYFVYLVVPHIL